MSDFTARLKRVLDFFTPENLKKQTIRYEGDTALLVIDVQKEFCAEQNVIDRLLLHDRSGNRETEEVAEKIQSIVPEFRKAGIPVYVVYCDFAASRRPNFHKFKPASGDMMIPKSTNSAFAVQTFKDILHQEGHENLLVCGFNLNACVMDTAIDGVRLGFNVSVLRDLCGNNSPNDDEPAYCVNEMRNSGVTIEEDVFDILKKLPRRKLP